MQGLFHAWRSRLALSRVGAAMLALSLAFTSPAFAIPTSGTYDMTGSVTGFFTVAGTTLTDYSFSVGGLVFTDETQLFQNYAVADTTYISRTDFSVLFIDWKNGPQLTYDGPLQGDAGVIYPFNQFALRPSSVPEPSSALLAGLGLLLLLGYGWRQRRLTGLQVG